MRHRRPLLFILLLLLQIIFAEAQDTPTASTNTASNGLDWLLRHTLENSADLINDFHPVVLRHFDYMLSQADTKNPDQVQYLVNLTTVFSLDQDPVRASKFTELQTDWDQIKK